jgi:uncharacterized membrane protein YoaK (UPF0700 family)
LKNDDTSLLKRAERVVTDTRPGSDAPFLAILSAMAGAVDVTCFLALGGLFTAHITGNLVVLAAHYTIGGFGRIGPLLAVPIFVGAVAAVILASEALEKRGYPARRMLLVLQTFLLAICLALGAWYGPFVDVDQALPVFVGMLAVAAMATQNALTRATLTGAPSTTVMTANATHAVIDLVTLLHGKKRAPDVIARARERAGVTLPCVVTWILGCAAGAVLEYHYQLRALALPVALSVVALVVDELRRR